MLNLMIFIGTACNNMHDGGCFSTLKIYIDDVKISSERGRLVVSPLGISFDISFYIKVECYVIPHHHVRIYGLGLEKAL